MTNNLNQKECFTKLLPFFNPTYSTSYPNILCRYSFNKGQIRGTKN